MAAKKKTKRFTASHIMLYVILFIYILVSICGLYFVNRCMNEEQYEYSAQVLIGLFSYITITAGSGFGFYCSKAKAENKLQISNAKYKMRIEMAQKIFKENGNSLDEKSIDLVRKIISDDGINEATTTETDNPAWQQKFPQSEIALFNNIGSEEGLG